MTDRAYRQTGIAWTLVFLTLFSGCVNDPGALHYLGEENVEYYRDTATQIDFPDVQQESPEAVIATQEPRTINSREHDEIWELSISDAVLLALQNNRVIRQNATFMNPGNALFTNPDRVTSVYDPAIQESGVLFGGRGVESALAAFDARWDTSMLWGRNSSFQNIAATPGAFGTAETGNFNTTLSKSLGYGAQIALSHDVDYLGTNNQNALFPSTYAGRMTASYRQPLLAGAGTEFTRIAGPITQSFGGITGVTQGVVIARINQDITLADFEASVRNLVSDVENQYWDLYLAYLQYDTAVNTRRSAQRTWRDIKVEIEGQNRVEPATNEEELQKIVYQIDRLPMREEPKPADEAQALDAYYQARSVAEQALSNIYTTENQLRRLLGLPVNDGRVIRPLGEPLTGEFIPNWYTSLAEALTNRVELRRQKWNIKSLDLQLIAAKSLTQPRLDFVGSASLNGFGDDLLDEHTTDGVSNAGLNNMYGTLTRGDQTGWGVGVEMSVPIGFRSAHAQVRNIELRLAKAREVLSVQEIEISHELARAIQNLAASYQATQTLHNRVNATKEYVRIRSEEKKGGQGNTDLLLRAIASQAQAESAYHASLIEYNKAIANFQFRKGTLLEYNNIYLAEDDWDPDAYQDALRRARERSTAIDNSMLQTEPAEFSTGPYNYQDVYFEERIEPDAPEGKDSPMEIQPAPEPPPAPSVEAAQIRPDGSTPRNSSEELSAVARWKTLMLQKLPGSTAPESPSRIVPTSASDRSSSSSVGNPDIAAVPAKNPVELLSVSIETTPDPIKDNVPAQNLPTVSEQNTPAPATQPVVESRPLLQPLPQMYRAAPLTNPAPIVKPIPQSKLKQPQRPPVRSAQATVVKQPETAQPQAVNQPPAPRTPSAPRTPELAVAPKPPQTTAAKPEPAKPAPAPAVPQAQPPVPQQPPVQNSPQTPRRATEIELFE